MLIYVGIRRWMKLIKDQNCLANANLITMPLYYGISALYRNCLCSTICISVKCPCPRLCCCCNISLIPAYVWASCIFVLS